MHASHRVALGAATLLLVRARVLVLARAHSHWRLERTLGSGSSRAGLASWALPCLEAAKCWGVGEIEIRDAP